MPETAAASKRQQREPANYRSVRTFVVVAATMLVILAQTSAPSPLYPVYQANWDLAPVAITTVFAVYVAGLLATLIVTGSLSDFLGRRPVIVGAAIVAVGSLVIFATATNLADLVLARALQGASVGLSTGALGAALLDRQPPHFGKFAAVLNGVLPPSALTIGVVGSGLLVQFAPRPTATVYIVFAVLIAAAGVSIALMPDQTVRHPGALRSLRPTVSLPPQVKKVFLTVMPCMVASWALAGLYVGLGPTIVASILGIPSHVTAALALATVMGVGALTGLVIRKFSAHHTLRVGASALIVGPLLTVVALRAHSPAGFFVSAAVAGVGFGAAFQSALRLVLESTPVASSSGVLSTSYLVSYLGFGLPGVLAGVLVPPLGLLTVVDGYALLVITLAAIALALQLGASRLVTRKPVHPPN